MRADLQIHLAKWRLDLDGAPFETQSSQLAYVRRGNTHAVLKIFDPRGDERHGAAILRHWGGPAARVLESDDEAVLIERAIPGTTLAALFDQNRDDEATAIWCDVVQRLHTKPAPHGWTTVERRGRGLLSSPFHPALPPDVLSEARREYFDLCETQSTDRYLLHADLNHFNVLQDDARGWIVIDPKGSAGELAWETATFLRNPIPHWDALADVRRLERRVTNVCIRLNLDPTRVLRWCAAHTVLSCIWSIEDGGTLPDLDGAMKMYYAARKLLSA